MDPTTLKNELSNSKHPLALTGAGISVASGLPTFDISWNDIPVRDILTREFFLNQPNIFYDLYREILRWNDVQPNSAHRALAKYSVAIITQNIDGLHQKAGSKNVLELHGNLRDLICEKCRRIYPSGKALEEKIPHCTCGSMLRPDVVLFGDQIHDWEQAVEQAQKCDLMLVIGTSLQVAPANLLPGIAQRNGAKVVIINEDSESLFKKLLDSGTKKQ
ncbi:MAG: NAD-dependent deacetylase [Petroclostridium sp.]|jgi:NAD-dependent deacetylase|uniref:SIR2 family NAD-dependent protein deacylase n=1 Tax=Petroclostridium xylanilyticum TaxID=1792311 RepID=UPI000B992CD4|nr:Sir2 family NAD-dependent protein deacetylase [Petroclostridium xylanilyticum]MDK2810214.1 NAD-dependent deacetylase [Petroclostridium sp.]